VCPLARRRAAGRWAGAGGPWRGRRAGGAGARPVRAAGAGAGGGGRGL